MMYVCLIVCVAAFWLFCLLFTKRSQKPSPKPPREHVKSRESIYYESSYYKITQTPYLEMLEDDGKRGEYELFNKLAGFEQKGARFLFNLYIPLKSGGGAGEFDGLMLGQKGFFVLERRNKN
ncbi:MAG: NERD domain-containing protein, partial [Firmicutes bacterium]|nr:NERD domain-containing protein [Bacillota bacterium]